jgi:hypothetical protein
VRKSCWDRPEVRRERLRKRLAFLHQAIARVRHLGAEEAGAHFPVCAHELLLLDGALELLQLARIEVEEAQHEAFGVHHELPARTVGDFGAQDRRLDEDRPGGRCVPGRGEPRLVLVAQRQVQDVIEALPQPEGREPALGRLGH